MMLNINEEDLKAAIVERATNEFLSEDRDLSGLIAKEVKARLDKIFLDRANAQIQAAIDAAVLASFDREYQRVTSWGEPEGEKTSIRKQLDRIIDGYWTQRVEPKTGKASNSNYNTVTRAEYLMTTICAQDFTEKMKADATNVTGALKDGMRHQMGRVMDDILNGLFHVKSLQDQGKVEKPY